MHVTTFRIDLISEDPAGNTWTFHLVDQEAEGGPVSVATATLTPTNPQITLAPTASAKSNHNGNLNLAKATNRLVQTVPDTPASFTSYRAFSGSDPIATLRDAAYTFLMAEIMPDYDLPDIQFEDETIILSAEGERKNRAARATKPDGGLRPKSTKFRLTEIWF